MDAATFDPSSLISLIIPAIFIVLIVELILSATWTRAYFAYGLPLYWRKVPATGGRYGLPLVIDLEDQFGPSFWSRPLKFHVFSDNEYGFREELFSFRMFQRRSTAMMHGYLTYDPSEHQVIVRGYANWWLLVVLLIFLSLGLGTGAFMPFIILGIVVVITTVMYLVERSRYDRVADLAAGQKN